MVIRRKSIMCRHDEECRRLRTLREKLRASLGKASAPFNEIILKINSEMQNPEEEFNFVLIDENERNELKSALCEILLLGDNEDELFSTSSSVNEEELKKRRGAIRSLGEQLKEVAENLIQIGTEPQEASKSSFEQQVENLIELVNSCYTCPNE